MEAQPKPYFLPDVAWDDLPENVRSALLAIVLPAYQELVVNGPNVLERSAGMSLVFLLTEETIEQFEIGALMNFGRDRGASQERQQSMDKHLRIISAKQKVQSFLQRLQETRALN
jgi:hypothetical protein